MTEQEAWRRAVNAQRAHYALHGYEPYTSAPDEIWNEGVDLFHATYKALYALTQEGSPDSAPAGEGHA